MTAQIKDQAFNHPDWAFEPKLNGYRAIAYIRNGQAKLLTRGGHTTRPTSRTLSGRLKMVLDAEIVAFHHGRPSFEALQSRGTSEWLPYDAIRHNAFYSAST